LGCFNLLAGVFLFPTGLFLFQGVKRVFHALERVFHALKRVFHALKQKKSCCKNTYFLRIHQIFNAVKHKATTQGPTPEEVAWSE